jgi:uncharacterized protein YjbI with pentapeptide repeats
MKAWLIALVVVISAGCTNGVQSSDSSDTSFLVSTSSATTVVPTTVVKTTIPQTTTSQTPTSTVPGCEIFTDSICPPNSVDPRLACLPNCNGVDFTGLVAPGLNFMYGLPSNSSFDGANFSSADLRDALFDGDFRGVNFSSADLRGASFGEGDFGSANFSSADLRDTFFSGFDGFLLADFTNADLSDSYLNLACFGKKMRGVKFDRAVFYKVCFDGSDLSGATFINATLQSVCFLTANLRGVDFSGAISPKADETSEGMHGIGFPLSKIEGVIPSDDFGPTALDVDDYDCEYG